MTETTSFKIRLDSRQASAALQRLQLQAQNTAGRIGKGIRDKVGSGLKSAVGGATFGVGVGTGLAAVRQSSSSGIGDILSESFGPIGAKLNEWMLGKEDDEARAGRAAREEIKNAFAYQIGANDGKIPQGAYEMFDNIKKLRLQQEQGKSAIDQDPRFAGGIDVEKFGMKIVKKLGKEMFGVAKWLLDQIPATKMF